MSRRLAWTNQRRRLGDLTPWPINPRHIDAQQAERLGESFDEFDQVEPLAIGPENDIYNGHQRLKVLTEMYGPDHEVDVRVASRPLTEDERKKLTVYLHRGATGEWDWDTLVTNFEMPDLLDWGFKPYELGMNGERDDPLAEWQGMPEFKQEDLTAYRSIHVHFKSEEDVQIFAELVGQEFGNARSIWFPEQEPIDMTDVYDEA